MEILARRVRTENRLRATSTSSTLYISRLSFVPTTSNLVDNTAKMASPSNLPPIFNPTSQDIEMLLAAQSHLGSKNLQVHMDPYLWKTRPDGINVINLSKTW